MLITQSSVQLRWGDAVKFMCIGNLASPFPVAAVSNSGVETFDSAVLPAAVPISLGVQTPYIASVRYMPYHSHCPLTGNTMQQLV